MKVTFTAEEIIEAVREWALVRKGLKLEIPPTGQILQQTGNILHNYTLTFRGDAAPGAEKAAGSSAWDRLGKDEG